MERCSILRLTEEVQMDTTAHLHTSRGAGIRNTENSRSGRGRGDTSLRVGPVRMRDGEAAAENRRGSCTNHAQKDAVIPTLTATAHTTAKRQTHPKHLLTGGG